MGKLGRTSFYIRKTRSTAFDRGQEHETMMRRREEDHPAIEHCYFLNHDEEEPKFLKSLRCLKKVGSRLV